MGERKKGKRLEEFICNHVVLDLETTSNRIYDAEIIEIAAMKVRDGKVVDTFETLVNPGKPIPASATEVNHITDEMVMTAPKLAEIIDEFQAFIKGEILVGHNITTFDMNILYDAFKEYNGFELNNDFIDTLYVARKCIDCIDNYKLQTISQYYKLDITDEHRALKDCYLAEECFRELKKEYEEHGFIRCNKKSASGGKKRIKYSDETKALQELQGFLKGIIVDDMLTTEEIIALNNWVDANLTLRGNYPFDRVFDALENVLEDGIIDKIELDELLILFKQFVSPVEKTEEVHIVTLTGKHCCLTGEFACGNKKNVEDMIEKYGGICEKTVKKATDYVIVGAIGSENWKQGTYGGKIKKAMELQEKGNNIKIVSEASFIEALKNVKDMETEIEEKVDEDDTLIMVTDITEVDESWKKHVQQMLDGLVDLWELPQNSLYLAKNIGRVTNIVTSYSVCIYEPEYPKIPNRKMDQSRNSIVMNIKEKRNTLDLVMNKVQYESVPFDEALETKQLKSDPNIIHVLLERDDKNLIEFVRKHTEYRIKHYSSKASSFGCCSKFNECSDQKRCIHENRLYSMACSYRRHLDAGEIFYGKNRNLD